MKFLGTDNLNSWGNYIFYDPGKIIYPTFFGPDNRFDIRYRDRQLIINNAVIITLISAYLFPGLG